MADIFISYAREDQARVRELHDACVARGREAWVDWEGIEPSDTWLRSIYEAIDAADAVVVVLSPDWVASEVCRLEAGHAADAGKRLIPVVARDVDPLRGEIPQAIAELNWIFARPGDSIDAAADAVVRALDTNLDLVRTHTLVLTRARAWELAGRRRSPLLRGDELARAESWVARAAAGALPKPTELQAAFVAESRRAARARTRQAVVGSATIAAIATVLAVFALISRARAIHESHVAFGRELTADSTAQLTNDPELSLLLAQQALRTDASPAARLAFVTALDDTTLRGLVHFGGPGVLAVAWSPDGKLVALAGQNGEIGLWNAQARRLVGTMRANGHAVQAVAFSPDGKLLASAGQDDEVHLWNVATRRAAGAPITGHTKPVYALAFSSDGRFLASGAGDGTALVSVVATGKSAAPPIADPAQGSDRITGVAIGPRDDFVVTADATDGYTVVWRLVGGRWTADGLRPPTQAAAPQGLALSPDGSVVAVAGNDGVLRLWRWQTSSAPTTLPASSDPLLAVAFSRDGRSVAAGSLDGSARIWDVASGRLVETATGNRDAVDGVAFNANGSLLATAGADGTARLWKISASSGAETRLLAPPGGYGELTGGALEPSGELVLAENGAAVVRAWRLRSGGPVWQRALGARSRGCGCGLAADVAAPFAAVGTATGVDVLSTASGRSVRTLSGVSPTAVAIASREPLVAAGGSTHTVRVWKGAAVAFTVRLSTSVGDVYSLAFSPDLRSLAIGLQSGAVEIVDVGSGRVSRTLTGPQGPVIGLAFSPDGSLLAGGSADKRIWLWHPSSGSVVRAFGDDTGPVSSVAFSPDGKLIASSSDDRTARIWNASTGDELRLLAGDTDWVDWIGFSGDGAAVATTSADGTLRVWDSCSWCNGPVKELEAHARAALVRCFTADERVDYLHERHAVNEGCSA